MKFMVSLITDGTMMEGATPEEMKEYGAKMMEFMGEIQEAGVLADPGAALGPSASARTLRRKSGKLVVTDGPFAETKEQIAGYMVLECRPSTRRSAGRRGCPFAAARSRFARSPSGPSSRSGRRLFVVRVNAATGAAQIEEEAHEVPAGVRA